MLTGALTQDHSGDAQIRAVRQCAGLALVGLMLINLVVQLFAMVRASASGTGNPLAYVFSAVAILVAASSCCSTSTRSRRGALRRPEKFAWYCAFGLVLSLVWIYLEILRCSRTSPGESASDRSRQDTVAGRHRRETATIRRPGVSRRPDRRAMPGLRRADDRGDNRAAIRSALSRRSTRDRRRISR